MKNYKAQQERSLEEIEREVTSTAYITGVSKLSSNVLKALKKTPRHLFVPQEEEADAYLNRPLPIEEGQTISQPFIVALMTELLDIQPTDKVLEIGTGSGYQAAILSHLASQVYTIEVFKTLSQQAQERFKTLGYPNIYFLVGNGAKGWPENAPYHKIIVTAAAEKLPGALVNQLEVNGIMVIPLGKEGRSQLLIRVNKDSQGKISQQTILPVQFVPFKR